MIIRRSTARVAAFRLPQSTFHLQKWSRRQELHPHWLRSERSVSAVGLHRGEMALPAGFAPATRRFEAGRSGSAELREL